MWNASFKLTLFGCVISICCVGFASLDVVCDELNDYAWNVCCCCVSCVWMLQRGHSGDGCVLASTLCKYDLRKGELFVLSWARVRRVRRGSISSELLVCGGGVRSILLLPLVAKCLETIDVFIWRMFVFMSVVVTVWGSVGMFVV